MPQNLTQIILLTAGLIGCNQKPEAMEECELLFGTPSANTGLGDDACTGSCECGEDPWTPPNYQESDIERLEALKLLSPPSLLEEDPYLQPERVTASEGFCATSVDSEANAYDLNTFNTEEEALAAGATITHKGACGQCSSLKNLAVYLRNPDLTDPVRDCGIKGMLEGAEANIECLIDIGFDEACAEIWFFNTKHTREVCLDVCMSALDAPHHEPDGSLNACIQCDEDESGPVFKAVAGRTRRNSGLPSGLCRPCDSVYRVSHLDY